MILLSLAIGCYHLERRSWSGKDENNLQCLAKSRYESQFEIYYFCYSLSNSIPHAASQGKNNTAVLIEVGMTNNRKKWIMFFR